MARPRAGFSGSPTEAMTTQPATPTPKSTRWIQWALSGALVVVLGLNVWWFGFRDTRTHPLEGEIAPAFGLAVIDGKGLNGSRLELSDHRGKVVLLDFWATHCAPCKRQMPILEKLQTEVGTDKLRVVSVNLDFEPDASRVPKVSKFLADGGFTFPVVMGHRGLMEKYQFTRIPFMVVVDGTGKVRSVHTGTRSQKRLRGEIDEFLP
jgi:thiol-disulfide isomerase/thioredoxin